MEGTSRTACIRCWMTWESSALASVLDAATGLAKELQHNEVHPLHLLAAMLSEEGDVTLEILKDVGLSREAVMAALGT